MSALVRFACRQCGKKLKAPASLVGKPCRCTRCGDRFKIRVRKATGHRMGLAPTVPVPSAITSDSNVLWVVESLIGRVPFDLAAVACWHRPRNTVQPASDMPIGPQIRLHVGCIAVRERRLHFFDFGHALGDADVLESHLSERVRRGVIPAINSIPLSALVVQRFSYGPCMAIVLSGTVRLCIYPASGDEFPSRLWTALTIAG